jgi:phosphatidylserine/phosphatidylglycerophosphate/cardiolipin synthase-like enzyme
MRYKQSGAQFTIYVLTGTYTVSFAIDPGENNCDGLLGFSIKRKDETENQEYFLRGFKVFEEVIPHPVPGASYSTYDQPVQSFLWEDLTAKPAHKYTYSFYPVYGEPKNLVHKDPIPVTVETENDYDSSAVHNVFFNRGVASSQAYAVRFGNAKPDELPADKQKEAFDWLSRGLLEAILAFIQSAKDGTYSLRGCFYEFHYQPVLDEFKKAIDRGVDVKIIYDAKENGKAAKGKKKKGDSFPKDVNEQTIKAAKLGKGNVIKRTQGKSYIAHNKFIVLLKDNEPVEVWTGSTNISEGGIFGQTNVGHRINDKGTASNYLAYWTELSKDPPTKAAKEGDEKIQPDIKEDSTPADLKDGIITIFSPRKSDTMLRAYTSLLGSAEKCACITLAFGVNKYMQKVVEKGTGKSAVIYMMLEKDDVNISDVVSQHNVVKAVGSYIDVPLYQWTHETNTRFMGLNTHVIYIHSKFLLDDPLGAEPVIVSGSANFSVPSTTSNDENMVIIKGDKRAADIYFTEFMRIFNHYYFRHVEDMIQAKNNPGTKKGKGKKSKGKKSKNKPAAASDTGDNPGLLKPDSKEWVMPYLTAGTLKFKRLEMYRNMSV